MIRRAMLRAKQFLFYLNDLLAVMMFLLNRRRPRDGLTILCYHRTASGVPKRAPFNPVNVDPADFVRQIESISSLPGVKFVSLKEVVSWLQQGIPPNGAYVMLTFDDGWQNTIPAATLLSNNGIPAVIFVPTAYLGSKVFQFFPYDVWCSSLPDANPFWYTPLTVDDCFKLRALGMDIQPHGHSHASLGNLGANEMEEDIRLSIEFIRRAVGCEVLAFSYPHGSSILRDWTKHVATVLNRSGVKFAVTTDAGTNRLESLRQEALWLKRIPVNFYDKGLLIQAKAAGYSGALSALQALYHPLLRLVRRYA